MLDRRCFLQITGLAAVALPVIQEPYPGMQCLGEVVAISVSPNTEIDSIESNSLKLSSFLLNVTICSLSVLFELRDGRSFVFDVRDDGAGYFIHRDGKERFGSKDFEYCFAERKLYALVDR